MTLRDEDNCLSFVFNPGSQQDHCSHSALTHGIGFDKYLALKMKKRVGSWFFPGQSRSAHVAAGSWMQRRLAALWKCLPASQLTFLTRCVTDI